MTGALSPMHWAIIIGVLLLLFGGRRLPEAARGLGRSLRILKAETATLGKGDDEAPEDRVPEPPTDPSAAPLPSTASSKPSSERAA